MVVLDERPSGVARVVASGASLIVPDAHSSREVRQDLVERFDVASLAYVPVSWGGEVRYVAILISQEPREFGADALLLAETLANQAAARSPCSSPSARARRARSATPR